MNTEWPKAQEDNLTKQISAVVFSECTEPCPENCINNGKWKYRKNKYWPATDIEKELHWKTGDRTNLGSFISSIL